MTNNKITHSNPISGDRHPQSENHIKIVGIICLTIVLCVILICGFILVQKGNIQILAWAGNVSIFGTGFFSALGVMGAKKAWTIFKNE